MADDQVYGFGKNDADAVIRLIGGNGGEERQFSHPEATAGASASLFQFELTGTWSSNVADADITTMAGAAVESDSVSDPRAIFATLGIGDGGLCLLQDGVYYVIQANCPA